MRRLPLSATLQMPSASDSIITTGVASDLLSWRLNFARQEERWDLDRGVVAFGEDTAGEAESRGLHLRGRAETVTLQRWFDRRRENEGRTGIGDRIRSADMVVDNLFMFGQHIRDHRVQFDRSAQEWLVQVEGEEIVGTASVPYDFTSGRPLLIDMTKWSCRAMRVVVLKTLRATLTLAVCRRLQSTWTSLRSAHGFLAKYTRHWSRQRMVL